MAVYQIFSQYSCPNGGTMPTIQQQAATNLTDAPLPQTATINLTNGTFQATADMTTNDTQFLRLKLGIPAVW